MIYEIEMTEAAKKDLQSIFEYIAFVLQELENAKKTNSPFRKSNFKFRYYARKV